MDLIEITADARPDFDGCRRFQPPDVFVPLDDFALDGLDNGHNGRRWRWLGMFSATGEQRANRKREECQNTARFHRFNPWLASGPRRTTAICPHHAKFP